MLVLSYSKWQRHFHRPSLISPVHSKFNFVMYLFSFIDIRIAILSQKLPLMFSSVNVAFELFSHFTNLRHTIWRDAMTIQGSSNFVIEWLIVKALVRQETSQSSKRVWLKPRCCQDTAQDTVPKKIPHPHELMPRSSMTCSPFPTISSKINLEFLIKALLMMPIHSSSICSKVR